MVEIQFLERFFLIQKFLTLVLGISLYHIMGVEGVLFALVLSYIPYIWIIYKEFKENKVDFSLLKSRKGFLINNYGINISVATGGQIDKLIIVPLLGFGLLGNYSLAMQVIVVLMILPNIIFKFLLTQDSSGENTEKLKIYTITKRPRAIFACRPPTTEFSLSDINYSLLL